MKVEVWKLSRIKPYPRNARKIPQKAIDKVAASLQEFGWRQPIVVDKKGVIVAGHTRYLAAQKLGLDEAPVHVASNLSAAQIRAYRLADNRTNEESSWDMDLLAPEIQSLAGMKFDLSVIGFTVGELAGLMPANTDEPEAQLDRAEELQAKWKVERGQVWLIGEHRLMCGDSTSQADITRVLKGAKPVMCATDPPYGVKYDSEWRAPYSSGEYSVGTVTGDEISDWSAVWPLIQAPVLYIWHGGIHAAIVAQGIQKAGYDLRAQIIWNKSVMVFGRGAYHWKHEPCWYAVRKGENANWQGDRSQSTVWDCGNGSGAGRTGDASDDFHGAHISQKPVELFKRPMINHTVEQDVVAEPFSGTGSQFVAAQQLNRKCYGMEIEPKYCSVILERMSAMGLKPKLEKATSRA